MTEHPLREVIAAADRLIEAEDFDALMEIYADDATLVVKPGLNATGKPAIRRAFEAIAAYFGHRLKVGQGRIEVIEAGDVALVVMESLLDNAAPGGGPLSVVRRATYVFRKGVDGRWLCVVDNSYGTDLLNDN